MSTTQTKLARMSALLFVALIGGLNFSGWLTLWLLRLDAMQEDSGNAFFRVGR